VADVFFFFVCDVYQKFAIYDVQMRVIFVQIDDLLKTDPDLFFGTGDLRSNTFHRTGQDQF